MYNLQFKMYNYFAFKKIVHCTSYIVHLLNTQKLRPVHHRAFQQVHIHRGVVPQDVSPCGELYECRADVKKMESVLLGLADKVNDTLAREMGVDVDFLTGGHGFIDADILTRIDVHNFGVLNRTQSLEHDFTTASHVADVVHGDDLAWLADAELYAGGRDFEGKLELRLPRGKLHTHLVGCLEKGRGAKQGYKEIWGAFAAGGGEGGFLHHAGDLLAPVEKHPLLLRRKNIKQPPAQLVGLIRGVRHDGALEGDVPHIQRGGYEKSAVLLRRLKGVHRLAGGARAVEFGEEERL